MKCAVLLCAALTGSCPSPTEPSEISGGARSMEGLSSHAYVEQGLAADERQELVAAQDTAKQALERVFGTLHSQPVVLFCRTAACKQAHGAPPAAAAASDLGFARDGLETRAGWLDMPVVVSVHRMNPPHACSFTSGSTRR